MKRLNRWLLIWLPVIAFTFAETAHFGWNLYPKTDAEFICDGIGLVLLVLAFIYEELTER